MRIFTEAECADWCVQTGVALDARRRPARFDAAANRLRCTLPQSFTQLLPFARVVESSLQPRRACLAWVTGWGIFPSNENDHLYYRLRETYGDRRLLQEAPGHLCLGHEEADLVTLTWLAILHGWDLHLLPTVGYGRAFVCHDEWVQWDFEEGGPFEETRRSLEKLGVKWLDPR